MTTDLKELRVRLELFFELEQDANEEPTALGVTLLSAIDLVAILEQGNWKTHSRGSGSLENQRRHRKSQTQSRFVTHVPSPLTT